MANQENTIKTTVELDSTQAQISINKLNSVASDSTRDLAERIEAKNKQVKLQNELSKKTIKALEDELKSLKGKEGQEKKVLQLEKKLSAARIKAAKLADNNEKAQNKLNKALKDGEGATKGVTSASGKLGNALKALAVNPIVLVVTALVGLFKLLQTAVNRSSSASESFGKVGAALAGVFNGLIAVITPVVEIIGETLVFAIEKPKEAWDAMVQAFSDGWNFLKGQVIDRFVATWDIVAGNFQKIVLKMRIAWNNWTGDWSEARELEKELERVNQKIREATDLLNQKNQEVVDVFNDAVEAVTEFGEKAAENYKAAAEASEALANAERRLVMNRIALEKQQLKSLRLAEEQRQIRDDISRSIEERIEANTKLGKILEDQAKRELSIANQTLSIARQRAKAEGQTIENIEAIGDAELKVLEIRERITGQRSEQLVNEQALLVEQSEFERQIAADLIRVEEAKLSAKRSAQELDWEAEKALIEQKREYELSALRLTEEGKDAINAEFDAMREELRLQKEAKEEEKRLRDIEAQNEIDELEIERLREKGENTLALELELLERKRLQDVAAADLSQKEIAAINKRAQVEKEALQKAAKEADKEVQSQLVNNALDGAAEIFGISQEVAVARMIMAAPQAIAESYKNAAANYAPPLSIAMGSLGAATTVVPIIKGLADIKKARFGRKKSGGGSSGSISSNTAAAGGGSISQTAVTDIAANNASRLGVDPSLALNAEASAANRIGASSSQNVVFSESRYSDFQRQVEFREERSTV